MLIFEYQPTVSWWTCSQIQFQRYQFSKFSLGGGGHASRPPQYGMQMCFADYCSTITIISPKMDTVCYTLCVATPYILCPSLYFEVSPPSRSAPVSTGSECQLTSKVHLKCKMYFAHGHHQEKSHYYCTMLLNDHGPRSRFV